MLQGDVRLADGNTPAMPQRWRVQLSLPGNPMRQTLCVAEGGDALAAVIHALTRQGVSVESPITLEKEVVL